MRDLIKRGLELAIVGSGLASLCRRARGPKILVLAYHNVTPSSELPRGDSSLHLSLDRFRAQLDLLQDRFLILPLSQILKGDVPSDGTVLAITFDDAYWGAIALAVPELVLRGLPATIFVAPGLLGGGGFWWDRLADRESGIVPPAVRRHALWHLNGRHDTILEWARESNRPLTALPELYRPATVGELTKASFQAGIDFGSHGWSHANLAALSEGEAAEEAHRSLKWLSGVTSETCDLLSYPYGLSSDETVRVARSAGFRFAFTVTSGFLRLGGVDDNPFLLPRLSVPSGLSLDGLLTRVSGVWPFR